MGPPVVTPVPVAMAGPVVWPAVWARSMVSVALAVMRVSPVTVLSVRMVWMPQVS
jgi:hypothetical protein